ncbi:MAG TPA: hypothetical protein VG148_12725 [Pyrinomonadaceae bacterium]|nr:hypothetical protein [Pyrinomonadaceae bacterium]
MKKQITRALALFITGIIIGASQLASAQTADHVVIDVPFTFTAGERQLPAGRYTLRRVRPDSAALFIRSEDGGESAVVLTGAAAGASRQTKLTFRQYGDQYFLAGAWAGGAAGGRELPESRRERELRRELSKTGGAVKTVAINIK